MGMAPDPQGGLRYSILDPTGNITALVESEVAIPDQPLVAASIMERHPEVEQVGFVPSTAEGDARAGTSLRMAGGEFCGNASMCAAALHCARTGLDTHEERQVWLRVSGAGDPVEVRLREEDGRFLARIRMPNAIAIEWVGLSFEGTSEDLPVVTLEGISHVVIERSSAFHALRDVPQVAARAIRQWCEELSADGLGLMFLERDGDHFSLDPLVFVSGGETLFWERSCASGSSAVGMFLAKRSGHPVDLALHEPGGVLRVTSDPEKGETWLFGSVRFVGEYAKV